jgi:hypothetical protein
MHFSRKCQELDPVFPPLGEAIFYFTTKQSKSQDKKCRVFRPPSGENS